MSIEKKFDALETLMLRHGIPRDTFEESIALCEKNKSPVIIDSLLYRMLARECCCRFVDTQGRNDPQASWCAFELIAGESEGFSRSEILESPEGFVGKVAELIRKRPKDIPRHAALLLTVLEYYGDFQEWPEKSVAAQTAAFKFPGFLSSEIDAKVSGVFLHLEEASEVSKKLWGQLCLDWLPNEKGGRPKKEKKKKRK